MIYYMECSVMTASGGPRNCSDASKDDVRCEGYLMGRGLTVQQHHEEIPSRRACGPFNHTNIRVGASEAVCPHGHRQTKVGGEFDD